MAALVSASKRPLSSTNPPPLLGGCPVTATALGECVSPTATTSTAFRLAGGRRPSPEARADDRPRYPRPMQQISILCPSLYMDTAQPCREWHCLPTNDAYPHIFFTDLGTRTLSPPRWPDAGRGPLTIIRGDALNHRVTTAPNRPSPDRLYKKFISTDESVVCTTVPDCIIRCLFTFYSSFDSSAGRRSVATGLIGHRNMDIVLQYMLLAVALTSTQISSTESRLNEKRRDKTERRYHAPGHIKENICEIADRESKVHCYCESTELKSATRADCWVFNGGIAEDDPLWSFFNSQPYIEKLTFNVRSDGALKFVPEHVVRRLKRLQKVSIHYATLPSIDQRAFSNLTGVRELTLTNDKIEILNESAFSGLTSLVNLTIKENRIKEIQRDVFADLPSLKYLDLSFNYINLIHDGGFEHLNCLNDLVLESNSLSVLTRETFRGLTNLTRLDLRSNKLTMIGDLTFAELWNLNELLLNNNELKYLSERAFDGLSMLQKLSMTGNRLRAINEGLLEGVRGLELLDLRNNEIEFFTYETIKPIIETLRTRTSVLYLSGNRLACDCRLSWIHTLRNETKSEPLQAALDGVTCVPTVASDKHNDEDDTDLTNGRGNLTEGRNEKDAIGGGDALRGTKAQTSRDDSGEEEAYLDPHSPEATTRATTPDNQRILLDVLAEALPCHGETRNREDSLMLSSKIESFWNPNSGIKKLGGRQRKRFDPLRPSSIARARGYHYVQTPISRTLWVSSSPNLSMRRWLAWEYERAPWSRLLVGVLRPIATPLYHVRYWQHLFRIYEIKYSSAVSETAAAARTASAYINRRVILTDMQRAGVSLFKRQAWYYCCTSTLWIQSGRWPCWVPASSPSLHTAVYLRQVTGLASETNSRGTNLYPSARGPLDRSTILPLRPSLLSKSPLKANASEFWTPASTPRGPAPPVHHDLL
ncbi:Connectin [Eumeta japonica]|uniref:Connectin n=1 Tax=Eumeta variegata TaxID=151549 RepID=A0A4C1TM39_EUMVA|nr:Connectin [Eumeta japonica]